MTNQAIEVEGLPEGYRAVAYRKPNLGEYVDNAQMENIFQAGL